MHGVDVVSKDDIKKQFRDIIFVEDDDGNLIKYVRVKQNEKPQRNVKPTPAPRASHVKSRRNVKKTPPTHANSSKNPKATKLQPPPALPLKSYEIAAEKMNKCSVVLLHLSEGDIAEEQKKIKRESSIEKIKEKLKQLTIFEMCEFTQYALLVEPHLEQANGNIKFESFSDDALQLLNQYFTRDLCSNDTNKIKVSATQSGFAICLPDFVKVIISMPIWKNCKLNPLQDPLFVLGEFWSIDLRCDGSLVVKLPEVNGKRQTYVFSEFVWRKWIDNNETQSIVESHAIENQNAVSMNSVSLIEINTSDIAKLLADDELMAAFTSMDWLTDSIANISII